MQGAPVGDLDRGSVVHKLTSAPLIERLGLTADDCQRMLTVNAQQIKSLHAALSG